MPQKKINPTRTPMPEQPAKERIRNFNEVTHGYSEEMAVNEAIRCLQCARPTCIQGCPVNIDIPRFLAHVANQEFQDAIDVIKKTNCLPAITGRVCPQENQCEGVCVLAKKYEPVAIGRVERFVADWEAEHGKPAAVNPAKPSGKKAAVIGAGPAGLTAAADLAKKGHQVTVFEALHKAGGVLSYGIPDFRLPTDVVRREVDYVTSLGVEIKKDFVVGMAATIDELLEEYDAIFIGTGAGLPWFLGLPGENLGGVYSANEYLTRSNLMKAYLFPKYDTPIAIGERVITIGGGNTAMDAARTALRLGARDSIIVYRRSKAEMPARAEEVEHAGQEGVQFHFLTSPVAYHGQKGRVQSLECIKNELGEPDASGRRRPVPVEGSNFQIEADVIIVAIGQSPSPIIAKTTQIDTGKGGILLVDKETMKTSKKGVFAGGDIITGGATVILAMGQAKIAAAAMDEYLRTGIWEKAEEADTESA
ncbi:MAG: NADPH-dependent glutamate synthase [Anaerolineales bacterium]|nr:NADPH-dependent glutamate synthase [Anaerolineales bacterium]